METLLNWDIKLFDLINGTGHPFLDNPMILFSHKWVWIPLYGFIVYQLYRKYRIKVWIPLIAIIILITLTDQITSSLMKPFFERLRPCHDPALEHLVVLIKNCGGKYGFASSHAANTMGLATFTYLIFKGNLGWIIITWSVLVGYSRIYLGVHYPGDVIVGFLLGALLAFGIFQLMRSKWIGL